MRNSFAVAVAAAVAVLAAPAGASASVVYDLTLMATADTDGTPLSTYDGSGTITLSSAPSPTGLSNFGSAAVTFLVDGESFSGTATSVEFLDGSFYNASFSEQIGSSPVRFSLDTSGVYAFYYNNEGQDASGTIASTLAPTATPIPAALPLFASALGATGLLARRRKRTAQAIAA
jgi:hypothetical protein